MTRLPRVSGRQTVKALERAGFVLTHVRGSHHYLRRSGEGRIVPVPVHGNRMLPLGTLNSIPRLAALTPEEFERLLKS